LTGASRRLRPGLSVCLGLWLVGSAAAHAATITAASCSPSAVQAAINSAAVRDVVVIPNGTCTWTTGVNVIGKAIHIKGESAGGVILRNDASIPLFSVVESTVGLIHISHLSFVGGTGNEHVILVDAASNGRAVLIHENSFTGPINAIRMETTRGVIWGNTINTDKSDKSFVQCKAEGLLLASWQLPSTMGTLDTTGQSNVYVEDNIITRVPLQSIDPDDNCRIVIRHNKFDNSGMASHGMDTSPLGTRHFEVYENTFIFTPFGDCDGSQTVNLPYLFFIRGGSGVITDNLIPDMQSCAWGNKPEIVMTVMNLRRNAGPNPCWNQGWPAPHQIGQGYSGTGPVLEGIYIWNNTGGGNYDNPELDDFQPDQCGGGANVTQYLQMGRDYLTGAAKPGYAKYPYPHPLRSASTPTVPSAPSGVRIVTQ
jgi:hypothetical protein